MKNNNKTHLNNIPPKKSKKENSSVASCGAAFGATAAFDRIALYRSITGMTVIIGGYHVSLSLIACGTNSELSCSARSGRRPPFPFSFSFLLPRTAANESATAEDTRGGRALFRDRGQL